jgi:hypothetical protein
VFVGVCNMLSVPVSVSIHDPHLNHPSSDQTHGSTKTPLLGGNVYR